jgi:SAM-dependent methyltransferase
MEFRPGPRERVKWTIRIVTVAWADYNPSVDLAQAGRDSGLEGEAFPMSRKRKIAKSGQPIERDVLNGQRQRWEGTYSVRPEMFGESASEPARKAAELFRQANKLSLLELGAGQGRDTIHFLRCGFRVCALDYTESGLAEIRRKVAALGQLESLSTVCHDVRKPLPFPSAHFDACYSHMLFCMALTTVELEQLSREVRRVLSPGGICVYTVRHTGDAHYRTGIHRGEDMYEVGGFIVHFVDRRKVERLAEGFELLGIDEFEEGGLPRRLFRVTMRKTP